MKHWQPTDSDLVPIRIPSRRAAGRRSALASRVGLGIAIAFVVGLGWALAPSSPVAREVRR